MPTLTYCKGLPTPANELNPLGKTQLEWTEKPTSSQLIGDKNVAIIPRLTMPPFALAAVPAFAVFGDYAKI